MKEFIVSILSFLGFGTNGVMTQDPKLFAGRINTYCNDFNVDEVAKGEDYMEFKFAKGEESFILRYEFTKESRRITALKIK